MHAPAKYVCIDQTNRIRERKVAARGKGEGRKCVFKEGNYVNCDDQYHLKKTPTNDGPERD